MFLGVLAVVVEFVLQFLHALVHRVITVLVSDASLGVGGIVLLSAFSGFRRVLLRSGRLGGGIRPCFLPGFLPNIVRARFVSGFLPGGIRNGPVGLAFAIGQSLTERFGVTRRLRGRCAVLRRGCASRGGSLIGCVCHIPEYTHFINRCQYMRKFFYAYIPMRGYTDIWEYSERNNTTTSTTFTSSDPSPMPPICGQARGRTSGERTGT